jgi:hypothetical protein
MQKAPVTLEKTIQKYFKIFALLLIAMVVWRGFVSPSQQLVANTGIHAVSEQDIAKIVDDSISKAIANAVVNKQFEVLQNTTEQKIISNESGIYIFIPKNSFSENVNELTIEGDESDFKILKSAKKSAEEPVNATPAEDIKN